MPVYAAVLDEIARSSRLQTIGIAKGLQMEIFAITAQRRLQHPGESDLVHVVGQLWKLEHEQTRLASLAEKEGNTRHAQPWRQSAAKATQLAERLSRIGGAP